MIRSLEKLARGAAVLACLAFGVAACGPEYDRTEITGVKGQATLGGNISTQKLEVPEGLVITAHIVVWNDDNEQMSLSVRSSDPSVVEIAGVVNERNYAFIGLKPGTAVIEVVADGDRVLSIPATVSPQPEMP